MRIFLYLFGFGLMVIGLSSIILYLNIVTIGYNFSDYVHFISRRVECYFPIIGFIIIILTLKVKGDKIYELHL